MRTIVFLAALAGALCRAYAADPTPAYNSVKFTGLSGLVQANGSSAATAISIGSGVSAALGGTINTSGGLLSYSIIGTSGATIALNNANAVISGNRTFSSGLTAGLGAAISTSSWPTEYLPGSTNTGGSAAYIVSTTAQWGSLVSAIRTSDYAGVTNAIADTALAVADSTSNASLSWGRYTESIIKNGATPYLVLGHENSMDNRAAACATIDPFTYASGASGICVVDRLDSGIGGSYFTASISGTTMAVTAVSSGFIRVGYTISGSGVTAGTKVTGYGTGSGGTGTYTVSVSQTTPSTAILASGQRISALADYVYNQGTAQTGINVDYRALDTSSGYAAFIKMGPQMGFSWYNGGGSEGWRIATTGNAGFGEELLGNNQWDLYLGSGNAYHPISATATGVQIGSSLTSSGTAPTCSVSGAGTGATCAVATGSNAVSGKMTITAGTTPASFGSITLTLAASVGSHNANCAGQLSNGSGGWNGTAGLVISGDGASSHSWAWNNNGSALTASSTYSVAYRCVGY